MLIAAIVGYIVYYGLEWLSARRAKRLSFRNSEQEQSFHEDEAVVIDEIAIVTSVDEKGEEEIFVVEKETIVEHVDQPEDAE